MKRMKRVMEQWRVGRSDVFVSRLGLGGVTFGREIDEAESFRLLDQAVDGGITLLDTAEGYGGGNARLYRLKTLGVSDVREKTGEMYSSEKIIGRWLRARGKREQVILQTKISGSYSKPQITRAVESSLSRLQTDRIDLYLLHQFDASVLLAEAIDELDRAVQAGKIRAFGCSNFSAAQLREALNVSQDRGLRRFEVIQPVYNLVAREIEEELLPLCEQQQVGVITYSPLAAGFLSGKYAPDRQAVPQGSRFDVIPGHADIYFHEKSFRTLDRLRELAAVTGIPMARLALGWALNNQSIASVLIGATAPAHITNGLEALQLRFQANWLI
jgi:aryl-alcohol dehydrogenase-like predicted oxidoreductase